MTPCERTLLLPLRQTGLGVASPTSSIDESVEVIAYGVGNSQEARSQVLTEAIRRYTQALPVTRGMIAASMHGMEVQGNKVFPAQAFSTWSGSRACEPHARVTWMPAFSLFAQQYCYVPAAAVYPHSSLNHLGIFERTAAGSAAGTTFRGVLSTGLLSALGYQHLRDLMHGYGNVIEIDPEEVQADDHDLIFLLRSVKHFDCPFKLLELDHPSPLHIVFASTADSATVPLYTIGVGLSSGEAMLKALLEFLGTLQVLQTSGSRPSARADMFPRSMVPLPSPNAKNMSPSQKPTATMEQIEDYLKEHTYDVLIVNTTTPDIQETTSFLSGMVLLAHSIGRDGA